MMYIDIYIRRRIKEITKFNLWKTISRLSNENLHFCIKKKKDKRFDNEKNTKKEQMNRLIRDSSEVREQILLKKTKKKKNQFTLFENSGSTNK